MEEYAKNLIKELHEFSECGLMDCKKALEESENDMLKAFNILRRKHNTHILGKAHYKDEKLIIEKLKDR